MRATEAAYLAGIIDGEGSISFTRVNRYRRDGSPYWRVVVAVSSCDRGLVDWLAERLPGATLMDMDRGPNRRPQHRWTASTGAARVALDAALPYLIIKRQRAEWALEAIAILAKPVKPYASRPEEDRTRLFEIRERFDTDRKRSWAARNRPALAA